MVKLEPYWCSFYKYRLEINLEKKKCNLKMEGQAISDLQKSAVTCMCWRKFWFSRSTCKEGMSQSQYSGKREAEWKGWSSQRFLLLLWVHSQSGPVLIWSRENRQQSTV